MLLGNLLRSLPVGLPEGLSGWEKARPPHTARVFSNTGSEDKTAGHNEGSRPSEEGMSCLRNEPSTSYRKDSCLLQECKTFQMVTVLGSCNICQCSRTGGFLRSQGLVGKEGNTTAFAKCLQGIMYSQLFLLKIPIETCTLFFARLEPKSELVLHEIMLCRQARYTEGSTKIRVALKAVVSW